tara:strand:- start:1992 stop:2588 length:597 start_codon:yes stop_codon:yes gene_type:complete
VIVKFKGQIEELNEDSVHLFVNGITYKIFVTTKDIKLISQSREIIEIHINQIFREDGNYFFGFLNLNEKVMFENLIKVHGVGGKMALNILSVMDINELRKSVQQNKYLNFTKISGVGNKLAQRLITEMKDKIDLNLISKDITNFGANEQKLKDLTSCLVNLGFQNKISEDIAISIISEYGDNELENLIPKALKLLENK